MACGASSRWCVTVEVLALTPAPVVARVATLTGLARSDVDATFAKDVAVAGWLAGQGAPVVPPSGEVPPGPHRSSDGRTITFWTYVPHDRDHIWRPAELGPLLADLHAALRTYPGALPGRRRSRWRRWSTCCGARCARPAAEAEIPALLADTARITDELAGTPVHYMATLTGKPAAHDRRPVWTDFEDAWLARRLDLACLELTSRLDGRAAVAGYPGVWDTARFLAGRRLEAWCGRCCSSALPDRGTQSDVEARVCAWRAGR